jgi:2-(1,2-epoxy-1,2-dihydrophenyl)acetyl-CoA isomerase
MGTATELDTGTDQLLCRIEAGVATITLNRPGQRNALSNELTPALRQTLLTVEADPDVRCVVVTGAGKAFCAGGDVSGMGGNASGGSQNAPPAQTSPQDAVRRLQLGQEMLTLRLFDLAKPTIAALPGPAAGAGLSIALACDLRIAAASAFLVTAFANIGLSGDYGGSWLLTQLVGVARAKELYYTSRRVGAEEARALGIVNEVVPDEQLEARTCELAQAIAAGPPIALRYMKQNLNRAVGADLRTCLAEEAERMVRCTRTDDHREAVRAFLEKRKPTFAGR